ncbi:exo-alpha-sialidase [Desertihabitans brevis]|uniref:exo-alpha-sialidase n=1 Tax=Desertihabitans brevis TaxID=2268447 RepID=A0A367YXD5_9ACTN|nr:sialidase family protein [Desertihabitans brevis]RCK69601.1 exo-alpha-sialidase [Desertihabitans brevis]
MPLVVVADEIVSVPFRSGTDGYHTFRIPALLRTPAGTLLAFAEGRVAGGADAGEIDVVLRRSTDGGRRWGPLLVVRRGEGHTVGNPCPVVDPTSGDVVLLTCGNAGDAEEEAVLTGHAAPRTVHVQRSGDDGLSWSPPAEITDQVRREGWRWYATGPGHAIALRSGPHRDRLVAPANHSAAPAPGSDDTGAEPHHYGGHLLCSDDGGHSWHLGLVDPGADGANPNESQVAELEDGTLYLTSRDQLGDGPGNRLQTWSDDGGETARTPYTRAPDLDDLPVVQAAVVAVDGLLVLSGPSDPRARRSMALWVSADAGHRFTRALTLSPDPAGYSDLVALDGAVGLLCETGPERPSQTLTFRSIPLDRLR